jgi:hypothetical protein
MVQHPGSADETVCASTLCSTIASDRSDFFVAYFVQQPSARGFSGTFIAGPAYSH